MTRGLSGLRPGAGAGLPWRGVLIVWLLVSAMMLLSGGGRFSPAFFLDGDDALRLQQVRDLLAGQSWFDLHQYRIAPPEGVAMHWTRVVDLPLAALILLLRPVLGQAQAEIVTIVLVPLLSLLCAMALAARLANREFGPGAGVVAAVLVAASVPASFRMMPLRIDHHAWQFVLALVALNGLFARSARSGGVVAGLALALALAISLESLPLTVIVGGLCTLRMMRGESAWLIGYLVSLALASLALFLATRGLSDLAQHCDAMSPVHVAVLLWIGAGAGIVLPRLRRRPPVASLVALGLLGLGGLAIAGTMARQCLTGDAFAALDPLVRKVWLDSVLEGLPVWRQEAGLGATMMLMPLFGLWACLRLWQRAREIGTRRLWQDYALVLAGATLVGLLVARASGVACLFAAVPAAWQLEDQFNRWREDALLWRRLGRIVLMLALLLPGVLVAQAMRLVRPSAEPAHTLTEACRFEKAVPALAALPRQTLLTGLDIGPTLLVTTRHKVVATAHHRASAAMRDVLDAFLRPDEVARRTMAKRGATLVVICPGGSEAQVYARIAPQGFMAHLIAGNAPDWLEPVPIAGQSGVKAWAVRGP
ncbi:hypothetical protein [Novosphingobium jiangmenense]|uniref:AcrB/AcrD/AcrF family protein n=1 Tax=Novosphingobium jiangmenense TaxID=2791981 RepID=A0ABS0HF34_9SPHN|nr:hypothetical protein [Novosphingobium jiangmenense]MBF9150874.1 hypothetical protein [Novosphingobium jiangmenense]